MTAREDFLTRLNAAKREEKTFGLIWVGITFTFLLANIPVGAWMDNHNPPKWIQVIYGCFIVGFLISVCVLSIVGFSRRIQKFDLACPNCGKPLVQAAGRIAITTGKCFRCGTTIFQS